MLISITIPTMKTQEQIQPQINNIKESIKDDSTYNYEIIASCINQSAAKNRNWCLNNAKGDIIIQNDDDVEGYYSREIENWVHDLILPLIILKVIY